MRVSDSSSIDNDRFVPSSTEQERIQSLSDDISYARALINTVHDALIVLDHDLRIQEANQSFYTLFQVTAEAVLGRLIYDLWDNDELRHLLETVTLKDDHVRNYYLTHTFPGIGERIMRVNARRFTGHKQQLVLLAMDDVTTRRREHVELEHFVDELSRSNDDLEQFAFVASHDLQAPLRTIMSFLQLLQDRYKGALGADADEFIDFTLNSAAHLQQMTHDLLEYAQVNQQRVAFERVELQAVLDDAMGDLLPHIEAHKAVLTADPLPTVIGDADQLKQLFRNLIDNAIKFRKDDKPPEIHIGAEREADEWIISVQDDGIGIEPKHRERVFELFQRVYSRGDFPGSGIGLAISKKIVETHKGRIWVETQPGHGAIFFFTLPERTN